MHFFWMGLIMGFGVALPVGPLNLEIVRRTFRFGVLHGFFLGMGAVISDVIYLLLVSIGFLSFLNNGNFLQAIGIIGSIFIAYFGYKAIIEKADFDLNEKSFSRSYLKQCIEGFIIAFFNPFVIVFWISLSSQIASMTNNSMYLFSLTALGVVSSATLWLLFINLLVAVTRKKISITFIKRLNIIGGILLICIAGYCFVKSFYISMV